MHVKNYKSHQMTIHQTLTSLENATNPVAKVIHQSEHSKVIVLGFKEGMTLADHKTNVKTTLVVIKGTVCYLQDGEKTILHQFDQLAIPVNLIHAVQAIEDSVCFLIRS